MERDSNSLTSKAATTSKTRKAEVWKNMILEADV